MSKHGIGGAVLLMLIGVGGAASAATDDVATVAAKFGALPAVEDISLSPDGSKLAVVSPLPDGQGLSVVDYSAGGKVKPIATIESKDGRISKCSWPTSERIICRVYGIADTGALLLGFTRNFAVNADGSKMVQLTARQGTNALGPMQDGGTLIDWDLPDHPGQILVSRQFVPEASTGTRLAQTGEGLGVEMVDTASLRRVTVERPRPSATSYISDGHGQIRVMVSQPIDSTGNLSNTIEYLYRKPGSRDWQRLSTATAGAQSTSGFTPEAVDSAKNVAYGFDNTDGFVKLVSLSLDGANRREDVLSRPGVDVDQLIQIGRSERVVGASYATDRRTTEYFDPALKALSAALGKALPGAPKVDFLDATQGEDKLLLIASGDTSPGMTYLFDKKTRGLEEVLPIRPHLDSVSLAPMKSITFTAQDGTSIPGYLTLPIGTSGKGLPAIVMPHGGPSSRDEWGFDWLVQFFAARGYAVLQPNFRGSSGYGSAWYQKNGFQSWRTAIGDVNDAGRWLVKQGTADGGRLAIVGWSYGGYAALQSAALDPDLFKAIVAVAPVTDLTILRDEASQYVNGRLVAQFIGTGAHLREGSPAQNAAKIKAPVLLFHGTRDLNVGVRESQIMNDRLKSAGKQVTYIEFPKLDHQLVNAAARTRLLSESDAFLRKSLGM